ncbi:MAG: Hsp70 family protein [Planctomycetaceae bacterium]|nr:Hsp70 family protein [Planctomycetaceae bacterium]
MTDEPIEDDALEDPDQTRFHAPAPETLSDNTDDDETSVGTTAERDDEASPRLPVLGDYVLLKKIGAGGMGTVFKARHSRMDRVVALKVLPPNMMKHPEAVQRFRQEVKAAAQLFHPNIVTAFDAGEQSGVHFLVMEFVDGQALSAIVKEHGPFNLEKGMEYIQQASVGLQYAHDRGMVHRDIKPSNLMLDVDGEVKLLDMGTARIGNQSEEELTKSGVIMGTVNYMSPEQAKDPHTVDHRCDIYSLGCTFYYLLTGKSLYQGDMIQTLMAHANKPIPSVSAANPEIPTWVDTILAKMLAKNPAHRYSSLLEFRNELQELAANDDDDVASFSEELYRANLTQSYPVGVDFGTEKCRVSWVNTSGMCQSVLDADGDAFTPSTVLIVDPMDTAIGKKAVERCSENLDCIGEEIKRYVGRAKYPGPIGGQSYPPSVLAALLVAKLASDVQRVVGQCKQLVLAVPTTFDAVCRETMQHAVEIAGLDLVELVDESVASALAFYDGVVPAEAETIVVVDLGAGKLDVAAMVCGDGVLTVLSSEGDAHLGGVNFDELLLDLIGEGLVATYGYDPRDHELQSRQLMRGCKGARERLGEVETIKLLVTIPGKAKATTVTLTRAKLEELAVDLLERIRDIIDGVVASADLQVSDVAKVLLAGGASSMPMVKQIVESCFPEATIASMPESAVANGAAIFAGIRQSILAGETPSVKVEAVTARALGMLGTNVNTGDRVNAIVLPKDTRRPVKIRKILKTHQDNQQNLLIPLIEGESANPDECVDLGKCVVDNLPPNLPAKTPIGIVFYYDVSGRLSVEAQIGESQQRIPVPIARTGSLENVDLFRWREWVETVMLCSGM